MVKRILDGKAVLEDKKMQEIKFGPFTLYRLPVSVVKRSK